jgi:hypothetical protein
MTEGLGRFDAVPMAASVECDAGLDDQMPGAPACCLPHGGILRQVLVCDVHPLTQEKMSEHCGHQGLIFQSGIVWATNPPSGIIWALNP